MKDSVALIEDDISDETLELIKSGILEGEPVFEIDGSLDKLPVGNDELLNPGLADVQLAKLSQLGHRDKFPRSYDWENLLPRLQPQEELMWVVEWEKKSEQFTLFLGLKSNKRELLRKGDVGTRRKHFQELCGHFCKRAFPESRLELQGSEQILDFLARTEDRAKWGVSCLTGIPSPKKLDGEDELSAKRDEEERTYKGLNDAIESLMGEDGFTVAFVIAKANSGEVEERFGKKAKVKSAIAPHIKQEVGRSRTTSRDKRKDTGVTENEGESTQGARSIFAKLYQFITGASTNEDDSKFKKWGRRPAIGKQSGKSTSTTTSESEGEQTGKDVSVTRVNAALEFLDDSLEKSMKHLKEACGTGGYYGSVLVFGDAKSLRSRTAGALRATLSGARSHLRPIQILPFEGKQCGFLASVNLPVHKYLSEIGIEVEMLDCGQAGDLLLLPDFELPGCGLKKSVFYGRQQKKAAGETSISLGEIAFYSQTIEHEKHSPLSLEGHGDSKELTLSSSDLCSHLFIVGTTGSGKTERAVSILNKLPAEEFRVIVLETAKKTYRDKLFRNGIEPLIYTLGDSGNRPLRINPFYFDPGTNLKRHLSILADAMSELLPMEALIGPKLREAAERCYMECGWDIETGEFMGEGAPIYPDMILFNSEVEKVCDTLQDYGPEVKGNYRGALLNRARIFLDDLYQDIFSFDGNRSFHELFPKDVIIEMEEMPPSEINMPAFIISIIVERLRAIQFRDSEKDSRKLMLVIEEAHNVLHRKFEQSVDEQQSGRGRRLIEQVARLLQEGRGLGIGVMVVDQSSQFLADAVIANTNTKIVHRQEDGKEVETIGAALGLAEEDAKDLQLLLDGECVVNTKSSSRPVKLSRIPEEQLADERNWKPFDDSKGALRPPYYKIHKDLGEISRGSWGTEQTRQYCRRLVEECSGNLDLVRFFVGRALVFANKYDMLKQVTDIRPGSLESLHGILHAMGTRSENQDLFTALLTLALGGTECRIDEGKIQEQVREAMQKEGSWLPNECRAFVGRLKAYARSNDGYGKSKPYVEGWLERAERNLMDWAEKTTVETVGKWEPKAMDRLRHALKGKHYRNEFVPFLLGEYDKAKGKPSSLGYRSKKSLDSQKVQLTFKQIK